MAHPVPDTLCVCDRVHVAAPRAKSAKTAVPIPRGVFLAKGNGSNPLSLSARTVRFGFKTNSRLKAAALQCSNCCLEPTHTHTHTHMHNTHAHTCTTHTRARAHTHTHTLTHAHTHTHMHTPRHRPAVLQLLLRTPALCTVLSGAAALVAPHSVRTHGLIAGQWFQHRLPQFMRITVRVRVPLELARRCR